MSRPVDVPDKLREVLENTEQPVGIDVAVGAVRLEVLTMLASVLSRRPDISLRILCTAPGFGVKPPEEACQKVLAKRQLSREGAKEWRLRLMEVFGIDVDDIAKTNQWQKQLLELAEFIDEGRIRFRFYDRELVGSRALIIDGPDAPMSLTSGGSLAVAPSGGVEELHSLQTGEEVRSVKSWFNERWRLSDTVTEDIAEILRNCWACQLLSPREAYRAALLEWFSDMLELGDPVLDDNPMLDDLAEFQRDAYQNARAILQRYGGVFISDVVGLGKTYIGLALLRYANRVRDAFPLIIAPPRLCDMWEQMARDYGVKAEVLSNYQLEKLDDYEMCDLVLIDESHAFRNTDTNRYECLTDYLRPRGEPSQRQMILLTATPQNNTCWDVFNQMRLFPDVYEEPMVPGEELKDFFRLVDSGQENLSSLMQHVLVRRTRRLIKQEYPNATLPDGKGGGTPIVFPERRDGPDAALRYSIADVYDGLYERILETLSSLTYARYGLADYLLDEVRDDERYENLIRAGRSLRGLFKATLLKRCESSLKAFRQSLKWLIGVHEAFHDALADGKVLTSPEHVGGAVEEMDISDVLELFRTEYPADDFHIEALQRDVEDDFYKLMGLKERIEAISAQEDAKLDRVRRHLREHWPDEHRTILFSQFTDTAKYLFEHLRDLDLNVELITSEHGSQLDITRRFAPQSMDTEVPQEEQIDLLISTDVLAEGVNLQDADTIVNYDLHWNPVRLIQRAGRIDRIGSENDEIFIFNFLPETALEEKLGLEEVLRKRAREIKEVFGSDGNVLAERYDEHRIEEDKVVDTYTGQALRDSEEEEALDGLSHHRRAALALKDEEPEEFRRLRNLRTAQRAILNSGKRTVALGVAGHYRQFYLVDEADIEATTIKPEKGLNLLEKWSREQDWSEQAAVHTPLNDAVQQVEAEFENRVRQLRQQQRQPRLSPAQEYVRDQLLKWRKQIRGDEQKREVDEMIQWLSRGTYRTLIEAQAKQWRRKKLPAVEVCARLRRWIFRFDDEGVQELPDGELVVSVFGP